MTTRRYEKRRRADLEEETRRRIVAATSALHEEVGPARTTVKAIAERAGVARPTVYKHFPDDRALFAACGAHFADRHPAPDPTPWAAIDDPVERVRVALGQTYAYYAATERMTANVVRDMGLLPALREVVEEAEGAYLEEVGRVLAEPWPVSGRQERELLAVIGLALDFGTWQRLVGDGGLTGPQAAAAMSDFAALVAAPASRRPRRGG